MTLVGLVVDLSVFCLIVVKVNDYLCSQYLQTTNLSISWILNSLLLTFNVAIKVVVYCMCLTCRGL